MLYRMNNAQFLFAGLNSGAAKSCIQKFPEIEHLSVRQILKSGVIMKNYNIDTRRRGWVQLLTLCPISLMAICDFLKSVGIMLIKPKHILKYYDPDCRDNSRV